MGYPLLGRFLKTRRAPSQAPAGEAACRRAGVVGFALCAIPAAAAAALIGFGVASILRTHRENLVLWARAEALEAEDRRLQEIQANLDAEADAIEHDPVYIEKILRRDGRCGHPGEIQIEGTRP